MSAAMAKEKAATKTRTPKKRTAHVDDPSKPGTVLNVETNLLIAKGDVIREFCEDKAEVGRRVFKINDAFSKAVGKMVNTQHLNRRAANDAYKLNQMEDEELHEYLYHFFFYVKDLGLMERAQKQEEMFSAGETGPGLSANGKHQDDESGDEGDEDAEANGHDETSARGRAGSAARQVEEAAGEATKPH